jgi:hypothetical protein
MNERYRPVLNHEKRLWKIKHEPRMYEYKLFPDTPDVTGLLTLALLWEILNRLPANAESGIEGGTNTNAPESQLPSENSEA